MNGKPLIYFDSATTTQKPHMVIEAMKRFYEEEYSSVYRANYEIAARATEMYSITREKVQRFINARDEEEIVFTRGTTEAINLVAYSFGQAFIQEGDEIIISEMEHHSNIVPWQLFCEKHGAIIHCIPINAQGELCLDIFEELLNERTKLVSIAHIANVMGTINPIHTVIRKAHEYGAKVMIDGAQAVSHLLIDVQDCDADFYAFSGHKMYGPTGVGVLYGKKELLEAMPPFMGGGDMIDEVFIDHATFQKPPLRFEAGTPSVVEVIGLSAAIDYIESIGRKAMDMWQNRLLKHATEQLLDIKGIQMIGTAAQKAPILSFIMEGIHPLDLGTILGLKGIAIRTGHLCAQPTLRHFGVDTLARIALDIFNTHEEIDICMHAIKEAAVLFKPEMSY